MVLTPWRVVGAVIRCRVGSPSSWSWPWSPRLGGGEGYEFGTGQWIKAVDRICCAYLDRAPPAPTPGLRVNFEVTGAPEGIGGGGAIHVYADLTQRANVLDTGVLPDPDLSVEVDYDTARVLLLEQRPSAALAVFLAGRIRVDGDLTHLAQRSGFDFHALVAFLMGSTLTGATLADLHPVAAEIGERILAVTAGAGCAG